MTWRAAALYNHEQRNAVKANHLTSNDLMAIAAIVLIWGTNFVAIKIGLRSFTPFQLGALRYCFGMLPLVFIVPAPKLSWKWILVYGLFQGVGQFGLLFISFHAGMTAALASVLMQTQMFFTAFFSLIFLSERPSRTLMIGMLIAALGLGCFIINYMSPDAGLGTTTIASFLLCLGAASMWALSNIIVRLAQRKTPEFDVLGFLAWCSVVPILPFLVMSFFFESPVDRTRWIATGWEGWLSAAYLGWVATIFANSMWTNLLKRHGANQVAPFSLGIPVVGLASGIIFLGEHVSPWQWAGIVLTLLALTHVIFGGRAKSGAETTR
ncbi:MAG: EamA family transporter [Rhodocyclaceae bacterium]|nr:MAG: EamA family transporter [Rhodocyclaceae bacterium]